MISESIKQLVQYGLDTGLVSKEDTIYVTNRILEVLKETTYEEFVNYDLQHKPQTRSTIFATSPGKPFARPHLVKKALSFKYHTDYGNKQ